jgi:hypothetical protein
MTHEYYRTVSVEVKPEKVGWYITINELGQNQLNYYSLGNCWLNYGHPITHWLQPCTLSDLLRERLSEVYKGVWVESDSDIKAYEKDFYDMGFNDGNKNANIRE